MRRISLAGSLAGSVLFFGACSLINAPDEVKPPDTSGGGGMGTSTSSSSSSSSGGCTNDMDCPAPSDQCKLARCDATHTCVEDQKPNNTPCNDGRFCTDNDVCSNGTCMGGDPHPCPPSTPCVIATCDEALAQCAETPKPDGSICDDNDLCTATSTCAAGACVPGPSCMSDECNDSVCDPAVGCVKTPKATGTACGNTACSTGQCDSEGKCLITPINQGGPCDDGLFCTASDFCDNLGKCVGFGTPCVNPAPCVLATCDEASDTCGVMAIPNGELCDDGDACTSGETCNNNACNGGVQSSILFADNFANLNAQGWSLGPEWQIGNVVPWAGPFPCCGMSQDPTADYDGDGKVAGVQLGNIATLASPSPIHVPYYLTSPLIDVSPAPGPLYLSFYRWLNSDYPPFMRNTVEVSTDGGANWNIIYSNDGQGVTGDSAWTFFAYDVTAYKSATFQFRFSFDIGSNGVYQSPSWNIDHVRVQTAPCGQ